MQTFMANLKHAARNGETVKIGGGKFSAEELKEAAESIEAMRNALADLVGVANGLLTSEYSRSRMDAARAALEKFSH